MVWGGFGDFRWFGVVLVIFGGLGWFWVVWGGFGDFRWFGVVFGGLG